MSPEVDVERLDAIARKVARRLTKAAPGFYEDAVADAWWGMLEHLADNSDDPDAPDSHLWMAATSRASEGLRRMGYAVTVSKDAERAFRRTRGAVEDGKPWAEIEKNRGVKKGFLGAPEFAVLSGRAEIDPERDERTAPTEDDWADLDAAAMTAFKALPEADRTLLVMTHGLDGSPTMTTRQIADRTGVSHMTVGRRARVLHGHLEAAARHAA